jgi:hypothetical protein
MLDAASATGCHDLEPFRILIQKPRHKGTSLLFEMTQNPHLVRKALFSLGSAKGLMHPTVVAYANSGSKSVLDLVHFVGNMAQGEAEASLDETDSRRPSVSQKRICPPIARLKKLEHLVPSFAPKVEAWLFG